MNHITSPSNYLLIQSIAGTVIARASVEIKSMDAVSDWADLYRAAKSTTTVARGKLQHTSDSRERANDVQEMQQGEQNRGLDGDSSK